MSRYSGKCDCFDSLVIIHEYTEEELKNNVKIYVGNSDIPLKIESSKDLIPFYPYLIGSAYFDNEEKKSVVHLSSESFVDREERESLEFKLKRLLTIYNRCKRKKIEFNINEAVKEVAWDKYDEKIYRILAERVREKGKKATIDGLHLEMHEYYRKELVDEMNKNGLNPADYGYERFV